MADGGGGAATEKLILQGQKSTNQLRALLASLLPAADADGGAESSSGAMVEALLSEISDSLTQALASMRLGASYDEQLPAPPGRSYGSNARGGRRSRRRSQRMRSDIFKMAAHFISAHGSNILKVKLEDDCRTVLQHGDYDSYKWKKYGQKDILGAKFARSYFKCGHNLDLACTAKKQVQQTDADPSMLEITYVGTHTCDLPSASHHAPYPISSGTQNSGDHLVSEVTAVPTTLLNPGDHHVADVPSDMAWTPSMEDDMLASLLFIPSPACSQSELLSAEVPQLAAFAPEDPPVLMELKVNGRQGIVSDSVVPQL